MLFSEEKNQKTFMPSAGPSLSDQLHHLAAAAEIKVFWFFSSEKNILSLDYS
jgi:hypothetical protein